VFIVSRVDFSLLDQQAESFESAEAEDVLVWAWEHVGPRLAMSTAFGASGCVLIDIAARVVPDMPIFTIDTGYLFKETLELRDRINLKYGIEIESVHPDLSVDEQDRRFGKDLYGKDSDHCCYMRKVEPLHRRLSELDGWVASLRRDQGESRRNIRMVEPFPTRGDRLIAKFNPLARWTKKRVWDYIIENDVPYNPLMDEGYPSVGCWPCTQAVAEGGDERSGRWAGQGKAECGIHLPISVEPATETNGSSVAAG
jgi:phosphoadenosine phosphosulfate reductase